jgi:hypothetical protein
MVRFIHPSFYNQNKQGQRYRKPITDTRPRAAIGDNKVSDAANFGIFKQNWGMLRTCGSRAGFVGQTPDQWTNGDKLKYDET